MVGGGLLKERQLTKDDECDDDNDGYDGDNCHDGHGEEEKR